MDFPCGSAVKNLPASAGDTGLIPGWDRSPGEGNGNPLQYSCLENPMDRGALAGYSSWGCRVGQQQQIIWKHFLFITFPNHPALFFSTDLLLLLNCSLSLFVSVCFTWFVDSNEVYFSRPWLHHGVHTKYAPLSISSLWCLIPLTSVFNGKQKIKCKC